jgi:hypothetical protein
MHTGAEHLGLCENTDTSNTVNLHLHIRVAIGITEISQMRSPGGVLCVTLDDDRILVECVGQLKGGFGLLPGVEIIGLFSSEPVRQRSPDV